MCMEDYQIGLFIRNQRTSVVMFPGTGVTIPPNPLRVSLTIFGLQSIQFQMGVLADGLVAANMPIISGQVPYRFLLTEIGDLVQQSFQMWNGTGTNVIIQYFEGFMPREYLNASIDYFRRKYGIPSP